MDGRRSKAEDHAGWIPVPLCEEIITKPQSFVCAVDGSDASMVAFEYMTQGVMQKNRQTSCDVMHVFDESKDHLPPSLKPDAIRSTIEMKLTGSVSESRWKTTWARKDGKAAAEHFCERTLARKADFLFMGFTGRKGRKDKNLVASNVLEALQSCGCAVVVMKDESPDLLPLKRPAKFVVSVSLNKASTKAFLDALRLSQPGDEIYVVYVRSFMERTDSDYTTELRAKYEAFFSELGAPESGFSKFQDRRCEFVMVSKQRRESTPQAVVRFGEEIEADFMCVGTNVLRKEKGKKALGSVSFDICKEWERNFIVSHWLELDPELYARYAHRTSR
jgi:nucleotide-binding universal stress UspA family protein